MNQYYFRKLFHSILGWSQACIREWIVLKILMDGLNRYDVMFPWIPLHRDHCTVVEWNTFWNSSLIFRLLCCHDSCIQFICTMCNIKKVSGKNQSFIKTSYILRTQQNYDEISQENLMFSIIQINWKISSNWWLWSS